jgi:hypothetical protein
MAELLCCKRFDFAEGKVQKTKSFLNSKKTERTEKGTGFTFHGKKAKIYFRQKLTTN